MGVERLEQLRDWVKSVMKFGVLEGNDIIKLIETEIICLRNKEQTFSQCEECGQFYLDGYGFDYCPNCGLKLRGDE